jgi:hypothetical protein
VALALTPSGICSFDEAQSFRWLKINDLQEDQLSLPIDKIVCRLLKQNEQH